VRGRILLVDDDRSIREALAERFKARWHVLQAGSGAEALEAARSGPDVILLDLQLPHGDGFSVLRGLKAEGIETTVIVITAYGTIERAVEAMREGAYDFIQKPFEPALLEETIRRALERSSLRRENRVLRESAREPSFVVADPKMEALVTTARRAAASASTVLVLGESGTGKEVLARQIHAWSPRASGPFVGVNCAALAETLLESELFGHEKGAFTGAVARKPGKVELAHGGTLLLDEIGDVSPAFQAKLLRVLQERSFERVGGTRPIEVDVRVIAATNKDLKKKVSEGTFREDLFYRLAVISLVLPPLRERPRDVRALAEHFVQDVARESKRAPLKLAPEALALLEGHAWPGNIRELRNAIERAVVLCQGDELGPLDLPPDLLEKPVGAAPGGYHERVDEFRRRVIREALDECGGNQTRAAEKLGLQRTYLARLIRQFGL
jgi:DNA-binding NtrC family response regulator